MIGKVMEKVNADANDVWGTRPMAVFLMSESKYKENIDIDVEYRFDRHKSTPVMVGQIKKYICLESMS